MNGAHVSSLLIGILFLASVSVGHAAIGQEADAGLLDEIRSSWSARANTYQTARFQCVKTGPFFPARKDGLPSRAPETSITHCTFSGESSYQTTHLEGQSPNSGAPNLRDEVAVFHNGKGLTYLPLARIGTIVSDNPLLGGIEAQLAFGWFFEAPPFLYDERYKVLRVEVESGDRIVVVGNTDYNEPGYGRASRTEYEFSEALGWAVRRLRYMNPDRRPVVELLPKYTKDESRRGIPNEITYNKYNAGVLQHHSKWTIEKLEINIPIDRSIFEFELPHGTNVYNEIAGFRYVAGDEAEAFLKAMLSKRSFF